MIGQSSPYLAVQSSSAIGTLANSQVKQLTRESQPAVEINLSFALVLHVQLTDTATRRPTAVLKSWQNDDPSKQKPLTSTHFDFGACDKSSRTIASRG